MTIAAAQSCSSFAMACSSAPSAVAPGMGWSLLGTSHSHFHDPSAWRVESAIQLPLSTIGASPPALGVSLTFQVPLETAVSPTTRTSSTGAWNSVLNMLNWAACLG